MEILHQIFEELKEDAPVQEVLMGPLWTAVWSQNCGLALTIISHFRDGTPPVAAAGELTSVSAKDLAKLSFSQSLTERSIGIAAINSLLEVEEDKIVYLDASQLLFEKGKGKKIAMVGHFPFVPELRKAARQLWVLELDPGPDDLPAWKAEEVIPQAEIVAITGSAVVNGTIGPLLELCPKKSFVLILGPSTPLSKVWFDHGVNCISGSLVTNPIPVLRCLSQGGTLQQMVPLGVRKVSILRDQRGV